MSDEYEWHVIEVDTTTDGLVAAAGTAQTLEDANNEALHYALQYAQDGRVKVEVYKVTRVLIDTKGPEWFELL